MSDVIYCRNEDPGLDQACKDNGVLLENILSIRFQYIKDLLIVDDDDQDPENKAKCAALCEGCPYTETGKGRHYFMRVEGVPRFTNEVNVFADFTGDLLGHNESKSRNVWEEENRVVHNGALPVPVKTFGVIKGMLSPRFWKGVKDKTRVPEEFQKSNSKPAGKMTKKEKTMSKKKHATIKKQSRLTMSGAN